MVPYNAASDNDLEQIRSKLRPDVMILEMSAVEYEQYMQHATLAQLSLQMPTEFWVARAGYC